MSLFDPAVGPALDTSGNPISGARWQFTLTGTTTAAAVYADADLNTSLGSYVESDAAGRFVDIYLDDAVSYRARLWPDSSMTGTPIKDIDPINGDVIGSTDFPRLSAAVAGVTTDQGGTINAELAESDVTELVLPEGIIWTSTQISIPTGKHLRGRGREKTEIKALSSFDSSLGAAVVKCATGASGWQVSDLTVNANKVGLGLGGALRRNGILTPEATHFTIKRVNVKNCTGYGFFITGDDNGASAWGDMCEYGLVEDCYVENCEEHYEVLYGRFITFRNCRAADGDGDITCLGWFHPYAGATDITFESCSAYGEGAVEITPTTGPDGGGTNPHAIYRVRFINCEIHNTNTSTAFVTTDAVGNTYDLELYNTNISSAGGLGMSLNDTTAKMVGGSVTGVSEAVHLDNSHFEFLGTKFTGTNSGAGTAYGFVLATGSTLKGLGGSITASASGSGGEVTVSGSASLTNVEQTPAGSTVTFESYERPAETPAFDDFTWYNQGTSTAEAAYHGIVMLPQLNDQLHGLEYAFPGGDFVLRCRMDAFVRDDTGPDTDAMYIQFGPYVRDAAGQIWQCCIDWRRNGTTMNQNGMRYTLRKWTNFSTISADTNIRQLGTMKWVILRRAGGNLQMYGSHNGHDLQGSLFSEAEGTFLGAITHIGWGVRSGANADSARAFLQSWEFTSL